jgi:LysR family glycine cleavage system transcriptional activator
MDRLPLNALRAFAMVLERGGVRPAARALAISHSAVSRHLRELQRWLGVELLEEGYARAARPTVQGRRLAEVTGRSLREMQEAVDALRERRTSHSLTLSTTPSFAVRWLLPRLHGLQQAYPRLEVSVVVDQRLEEPRVFSADLAIRVGHGGWPELESEPLMKESLFPVMSPALWRAEGRPSDPAELERLRLVHDRDPNVTWQYWREKYGPPALDVRRGARYASSDLVLRAAAQGLGVALAPARLAEQDLAAGILLRPFGNRQVELGPLYWIVRPPENPIRESLRNLIAWLRREAAASSAATPPAAS